MSDGLSVRQAQQIESSLSVNIALARAVPEFRKLMERHAEAAERQATALESALQGAVLRPASRTQPTLTEIEKRFEQLRDIYCGRPDIEMGAVLKSLCRGGPTPWPK